MGEILRACLDQTAIARRPRWYSADIVWDTYSIGQELSGQVKITANTVFLWTSFGFSHFWANDAGAANMADFGTTALVQFTDLRSGFKFSNQPGLACLVQSYMTGQADFDEYPLLPGRFQLGWSVWPTEVAGIFGGKDSYNLVFEGIEYLLPKPLSAYGIEDGG